MLDYDREAVRYDETRGGIPRAEAAAEAVASLLPTGRTRTRPVLDVAGGTGLVASRLAVRGYEVAVCDRSRGMLGLASTRCPGRTLNADATRLPIGTGRVHAVTLVWLLHLLPDAAPVMAECARVLAPGGVLVTTVDKDDSYDADDDDIGRVLGSYPPRGGPAVATDDRARLDDLACNLGLTPYAEARFVGHGQGRSPNAVARRLEARPSWIGRRLDAARIDALIAELRAMPDPDRTRQPPTYTLVGYRFAVLSESVLF